MKKLFILIFFINNIFASIFWGAALEKIPKLENIYKAEYETGFLPQFLEFYLAFYKTDFLSSLEDIWTLGAVPCITIEPALFENNTMQAVFFEDILNGKFDEVLRNFTDQIKSFNNPLIIRFAHEMNLNVYHWGQDILNEKSAEIYIKMYRYVYEFFKKQNVKNTIFAFCPNNESVPNVSYNQIKNYFPGSDYVDILGVDGYNFGTCPTDRQSKWKNFDEIFSNALTELRSLSQNPLIIFETASTTKGGDKNIWIENSLDMALKHNIQGIIWFQVDKECDWKISSELDKKNVNKFFEKNYSNVQYWAKEFLNEKRRAN